MDDIEAVAFLLEWLVMGVLLVVIPLVWIGILMHDRWGGGLSGRERRRLERGALKRLRSLPRLWRGWALNQPDLIVGQKAAFEFKATDKIQSEDLEGLKKLAEEQIIPSLFIVSQDKFETTTNGIRRLYWKTFLSELWADNLLAM